MTTAKVIEEIMQLPRQEQSEVVKFALELAPSRQASPTELKEMADQLVDCTDPVKIKELEDKIKRGFYGE